MRRHRRKRYGTMALLGVLVLGAAAAAWFLASGALKPGTELRLYAKGAVVMSLDDGKILYAHNPDERLIPASMTKIMAMLLIFEQLESGRLTYDEKVRVSERAAGTFASKAGLKAGESLSVDDLLKCVFLPSGSDAVLALAEHVYGSEEAFVEAMNAKARELGLTNTQFQNSVGLEQYGHYASPRDMAVIAAELVTTYPEVYAYSSLVTATVRHEDGTELYLKNTNDMLKYDGVDGLKTGSSPRGGYNLAMTYNKGGKHLLFVVMGEETPYFRKEDCKKLLEAFT
jgi:D-alanyl-D-alanine carboxypeptidase (penicillin-binding protein 5/6)